MNESPAIPNQKLIAILATPELTKKLNLRNIDCKAASIFFSETPD